MPKKKSRPLNLSPKPPEQVAAAYPKADVISEDGKQGAALAVLEAIERAFPAKVEATKTKLAAWVAANTGPGNDDAAFTSALLELGIERLLELPYADENAAEELENIFSKVVRRNPAAVVCSDAAPQTLPFQSRTADRLGGASRAFMSSCPRACAVAARQSRRRRRHEQCQKSCISVRRSGAA